MAPLQAAALQYSAAISGGHACAETMDAYAAANLGLIGSLGHYERSSLNR
jgi:hypothetical protein